jgi:hypothetical protein
VLAALLAAVGGAGCTGRDGPDPGARTDGPEAAVRNLLSAIETGNDERIDKLTLDTRPDIEQQSVTVETTKVYSAERYAQRRDRSATAVRKEMTTHLDEDGFENYAFVSVDAELETAAPTKAT